ncbi:g6364 [Coccomyxa viridis]|uniref:G6364 protein n=1 Tax=Coccomyxa viridis TaxID=1274662 RepID=A0ABP1FV72_9CHLO
MEGLEEDIKEVDSLLSVAVRPLVRGRLALLLSDLQQEKRRRDLALQNFQLAVTAGLPHLAGNQLGLPSPGSCPVRPQLPGVSSSNMLMEGFPHSLLQSGMVTGGQNVDVLNMAPSMWNNSTAAGQRQFSQRSDVSDSAAWMPPPGAHALVPRGFPNPGWPLGGFPPAPGAGQPAGPAPGTLATADSFRVLTTCSWEQSDTMVKVYVPLRGVQTDMLRATFTPNSVEVKVFDLHGKNYGFTLLPTYQTIAEDNCVAVASKTRKNILITMQKLHSFTPEERQWRDLYGDRSALAGAAALSPGTMSGGTMSGGTM